MKTPSFKTKKELFDYLVKNNKDIVNMKKAALKWSDGFGLSLIENRLSEEVQTKSTANSSNKDTADTLYRTIIANTYKWMDSHSDVHIPGLFTKTLQENHDNIFFLHDHLYQVTAKVGTPLKIYEQEIAWTDLGVNLAGNTMALLADSAIKKEYNPQVFDQYLQKEIKQHSVAMSYVKMFLCLNDADYKEYFANWNEYSVGIGNIAKVNEQGYFWAITEAKLKEYSCVLRGSNEITGVIGDNDNEEPKEFTQQKKEKDEPGKPTQRKHYDPNLL